MNKSKQANRHPQTWDRRKERQGFYNDAKKDFASWRLFPLGELKKLGVLAPWRLFPLGDLKKTWRLGDLAVEPDTAIISLKIVRRFP